MKLDLGTVEFQKCKSVVKVIPNKERDFLILNEEIPMLIEFLKYCAR